MSCFPLQLLYLTPVTIGVARRYFQEAHIVAAPVHPFRARVLAQQAATAALLDTVKWTDRDEAPVVLLDSQFAEAPADQ
jgi:hypothetical protein